jgi:hypothetical protein
MRKQIGLGPEGLPFVEFVVRQKQRSFAGAKDAWSQPPAPHLGKESNDGRVWLRSGRDRGIILILPILVAVILTTIAITLIRAGLG